MKKFIVAVVLAAAAMLATPAAANAAGYVPASSVSVQGSVVAGGTVTVNFAQGAFAANENVDISVTGAGAVTLGALPTTTVTEVKKASASGSVAVMVTFPQGASGTYTLTATGATSGNVGTASLTVVPADSVAAVGSSSSTGTLAFTGSTVPMLLVWGAGGAVVLGGALIFVMGAVRRQRENA
ncbi:hypothetical protein [Curtobacterium ammoniigenes]|uniref:hypothetical protein n=1 Tax=Curtobacterium ammoniigenes TaxID=395387 RepID=UPI0008335139|nr:hypothetical protein [Curtobacterium ammoniigenes]